MKSLVVRSADRPLALEERSVPEPGRGEVRIRVHACGVCHSDLYVTNAQWPGLELPRVPGHEVAGLIDAVGEDVTGFQIGDRVGLGWHGGHDGTCDACCRGHFVHCANGTITGISRDGGYAEHVVAPAIAVARVPDGLDLTLAAPLLCAGVTTFNALRNSGARPGDRVAIQGLGGLGHLGVQFARTMGFHVVAVSRGPENAALAEELGAHEYLDAKATDPAEALQAMGGAAVILATAPNAGAISSLVGGLGVRGSLMVVGAPFEPIEVPAPILIGKGAQIRGWASGSAIDSTDTMTFAHEHGVKPWIETFPLDKAQDAVEHMQSGRARFRAVLTV